jgi:manganese/zinc/iron transport system substrate-binding protein
MDMRTLWGIVLTVFLSVAGPVEAAQVKIITTIGQITDVVQEIGGKRVSVQGLMGAGVDPHLYRASESDVMKLAGADVIFYNGLHLESKMGEVFERMNRTKRVVAVTENVPVEELLGDPNFPEYEANAAAYLEKLTQLHGYVNAKAGELPKDERVLVTAHDAFRYFGKRYEFEVVGLQGISTESEAGTRDVMKLADFIVGRKVKAIFVESSVPERNIKAVQEAVKARGWEVKIGGELFSDALGHAGTKEGTYIGMVEHNINTIVNALK